MQHYPFRWEHVVFPGLFMTGIYVFVFLVETWSPAGSILPIKHSLLWTGVLSLSFFLIYTEATNFDLYHGLKNEHKQGIRRLGELISWCFVFLGGISYLIAGILSPFNIEDRVSVLNTHQLVEILTSLAPLQIVVMFLFLFNSLWRVRYRVERGYIVILHDGIYHSGATITLRPWLQYEQAILPRKLLIQFDPVGVRCKDGGLFLATKAWVEVCLEKSWDNDILRKAHVGKAFFEGQLRSRLQEILQREAPHWDITQFMEKKFSPENWSILGVPCDWNGIFHLQFSTKSSSEL